jgi:hypothetical protein
MKKWRCAVVTKKKSQLKSQVAMETQNYTRGTQSAVSQVFDDTGDHKLLLCKIFTYHKHDL